MDLRVTDRGRGGQLLASRVYSITEPDVSGSKEAPQSLLLLLRGGYQTPGS